MFSRDQILDLMRERVHHPASVRELMTIFRVKPDAGPAFKRHIRSLVDSGDLVQVRGNRVGLPDKMDLIVGRLQSNPGGFGFVVPERKDVETSDVYISGTNLKEAMHGDRVVARLERHRSGDRPEGRIVKILERGNETLVGRYDLDDAGLGFVVPFDRRVLKDVHVPAGETGGARPGEMVTVALTRWPTATRGPVGRVTEVLGDVDKPGVDTTIIIRKFGIPEAHSPEAVEEARRLTLDPDRDFEGRTDFRSTATVTIDGEHARDFDDAVSIERLANGNYWLGVHIADVAHYVPEGSVLDHEAYERGTSVYFPERAVHMFPSELATGLCSLNPRVDRLVQSCLMEVDRNGQVVRYELHDGVIKTAERMTYTDVNAILTGQDPAVTQRYERLVPKFELMRDLFEILNGRRRRRGSIDFDLSESEVILDQAGLVEAIIASERNIAHRLIEEFMLLANETVAEYLEQSQAPAIYRVHEEPDLLKVEQFEEFVASLGYSLAAPLNAVRPRHFQRLLDRIQDTPQEKPIAFLMLRTMQKARYAAENLGHFGLAASCYTHFTSPIRRYPDLAVHRLLRAVRRKELGDDRIAELEDELPEVARHSSEMERRADDAERELVQWKKVRFMADKIGDEFTGFITGVAPFGLFVELVEHFVEGLVHVSSMADDYYRFLEPTHTLRGENTGKTFRLGDQVAVQVIRVDMERRQIDLGLVEILEAVRETRRPHAAGRGRERSGRERRQRPGRRERAHRRAAKGRKGRKR
ncbi:MAG: ribonuclease R [Vicinamibacterales bacterium]